MKATCSAGQAAKIEVEIFSRIFGSIVERMGVTIARTAHTTFVREVQDFGNALATTSGEFFAYPRTLGASTLLGLPFGECIDYFPEYRPDDVMFTNDPFISGAGCTHVPDLTMWSPVIVDGELLCFTWGFIHSSDIGGAVPGSIAPSLIDTFQEGIRIPPVKLYKEGMLNEDVKSIIRNNVRIPNEVWGDIQALVAGMRVARERIYELAERYGVAKVKEMIDAVLDYSELKARDVLRKIPDGVYKFHDYLEDDTITDVPIRIALEMQVSDGQIHLDYSGTDPQVASAYNVPTAGKVHPWVMAGLAYYIVSQDPDIPTNGGFFRAITVNLPRGSLVNPVFPAAIGVRSLAGVRMVEIILGVLSQAVPHATPAAGSGVSTIIMLSVPNNETGGRRVNVVNSLVGGSGGRPMDDGFDGVDFVFGFMKNTPTEILESETDILVRQFSFACDSGGAGKYRGGLGVRIEFQVLAPDAVVVARGMDRTRFDPWGVHGGATGQRMPATRVTKVSGEELFHRKIDVLRLDSHDTVRFESPGGGGYGDAVDRDPERVAADVESGFVSTSAAREIYGVVLDSHGGVLASETTQWRRKMTKGRQAAEKNLFSFGSGRERIDEIWTPAARTELGRVLEQVPILMRYHVKNKVYWGLRSGERDLPIMAEEVRDCVGKMGIIFQAKPVY